MRLQAQQLAALLSSTRSVKAESHALRAESRRLREACADYRRFAACWRALSAAVLADPESAIVGLTVARFPSQTPPPSREHPADGEAPRTPGSSTQ